MEIFTKLFTYLPFGSRYSLVSIFRVWMPIKYLILHLKTPNPCLQAKIYRVKCTVFGCDVYRIRKDVSGFKGSPFISEIWYFKDSNDIRSYCLCFVVRLIVENMLISQITWKTADKKTTVWNSPWNFSRECHIVTKICSKLMYAMKPRFVWRKVEICQKCFVFNSYLLWVITIRKLMLFMLSTV